MNEKQWNEKCRRFNYMGFGKETAKLWFVGMEFRGMGDTPSTFAYDERVCEIASKRITEESTGKRGRTQIYNYMERIETRARGLHETMRHPQYRDEYLLQPEKGWSLFTNLYPFPRPNTRSPLTPELVALGFSSVEDYEHTVQTFRFRRLREFWFRAKPEYTICFGGGRWADFKLLFELANIPSIPFQASEDVRYYEEKGVFLMPFFGRRGWRKGALPGAVADAVGDHIRNHRVQ